MKIWTEYGSEHSMRLVLIGTFKRARDAENVEDLFQKLTDQFNADKDWSISNSPPENQRFSEGMMALLLANNLHILAPTDLEQFALDHSIIREGNSITVTTDEVDVSAFIKILVDAGGRVEVYSEHYYPEEPAETN